jgi:hypothetical protein
MLLRITFSKPIFAGTVRETLNKSRFVIPAKAGIQYFQ